MIISYPTFVLNTEILQPIAFVTSTVLGTAIVDGTDAAVPTKMTSYWRELNNKNIAHSQFMNTRSYYVPKMLDQIFIH